MVCPNFSSCGNLTCMESLTLKKHTFLFSQTAYGWVVNVTNCSKPSDFCYALWKINEDFSFDIISQGLFCVQIFFGYIQSVKSWINLGCWESSGSADCQSSQCTSSGKATNLMHRSHFCCCQGRRCNLDISVSNQTEKFEDLYRAPDLPSDTGMVCSRYVVYNQPY